VTIQALGSIGEQPFFLYEGQYEFYAKGQLSEKSWQPKLTSLLSPIWSPVLAEWWALQQAPLSGEFREYLDSLHDSTDATCFRRFCRGRILVRSSH